MDDLVKAAMAKWPNVPDCRGWLGLDARGDWYLRDDACQAAGPFPTPKGSLLISPQATAHGITLTRADQVVWWGPVSSTEIYLQANSRAHRAGQVNHVTVTHLQGSPVERRMYTMLQSNIDLHLSLVDLYKQVLDE